MHGSGGAAMAAGVPASTGMSVQIEHQEQLEQGTEEELEEELQTTLETTYTCFLFSVFRHVAAEMRPLLYVRPCSNVGALPALLSFYCMLGRVLI